MSTMADRLYASTAEEPAAAPAAEAQLTEGPGESQAQAQSQAAQGRDLPDEIRALRDNFERRMYGESAFESELPEDALPGYDVPEVRQVAQDLGASSVDVSEFRMLAAPLLSVPATDEAHAGWMKESKDLITRMNYTAADLDLARRFVARDPRLAEMLEHTRLGSHPKIVEKAIQLARSARAASKFK